MSWVNRLRRISNPSPPDVEDSQSELVPWDRDPSISTIQRIQLNVAKRLQLDQSFLTDLPGYAEIVNHDLGTFTQAELDQVILDFAKTLANSRHATEGPDAAAKLVSAARSLQRIVKLASDGERDPLVDLAGKLCERVENMVSTDLRPPENSDPLVGSRGGLGADANTLRLDEEGYLELLGILTEIQTAATKAKISRILRSGGVDGLIVESLFRFESLPVREPEDLRFVSADGTILELDLDWASRVYDEILNYIGPPPPGINVDSVGPRVNFPSGSAR